MRVPSIVALLLAVVCVVPGTAQDPGRVTGIVVDAGSLRPVEGAVVRLGTRASAVSGSDGTFQWSGIPEGRYALTVEHIAFGTHTDSVSVVSGQDTSVRIRMTADAIELSELVVEAQSVLEQRRVSTGFSINEVGAERI